jgi:hypothetical protein
MIRLLGFLIGSATSVFIIVLLIGTPTFHLGEDDESQRRYDAAIEMLRAKQEELESVAGRLEEDVSRVAASVETVQEDPVAGETAPAEVPPASPDTSADVASPPIEALMPVAEPHWYSFWNPFRSEIAASGFVSQLERVTGIDYRIVKVETGVYEVAFAYLDDTERRDKLSRISAATGLDLPDSR